MRSIITLIILVVLGLSGCDRPKEGTKADQEAVKQDTVDPRQGKGEGEVGERVYGQ